ncbi:unnamed protein product [Bubo scandiacus]
MAARGGSVLEPGWLLSPAGRPYLDSILQKNQRRVFGLLEHPALPPPLGRPHRHLQTLRLRQKRRRQDGLGGHAGGGPPCPPSTTRPWACKEEADAILFLFSFTDRSSFEELPAQMSRVVGPDEENLVKVVVGTKFDLSPQADVTERDVTAFEGTWGVPVLRAGSGPGAGGGRGGLARVAPLLDALVERLWRRDQITAGIAPGDEGSPPG